jgi:phosphoenolpyruvate carboxylase
MATQHPDNAGRAWFTGERFFSAHNEIEECFRCFSELGVDEYMWDWEGKFVDEAVMDRLYNLYHDYFKENQIGKDKFLTFRIPNIWLESSHKLPRSFMNMISAEEAAKTYKFHAPPLFEVILPMAASAEQLSYIQKTFGKISKSTEEIFGFSTDLKMIDVIPLFEEFSVISNADAILDEYIQFLKDHYGHVPEYMRVFTARSDPAMNAGFLPAKIVAKQAISIYHGFGERHGIEMYPWLGGGSLPFRGGVNPENIDAVIEEQKGLSSITVQSAFRYDYPKEEVKKAIAKLNKALPENRKNYRKLSADENKRLNEFNEKVAGFFRSTVEPIAKIINVIAKKLPSHRERMQHIGLFGYSRGIGDVTLPRAIKFTGSLYSLGVPPELIASGRALKLAKETGMLDLVNELCPHLKADFAHAGHYLNRENLDMLCKEIDAFKDIREEIQHIEDIVGVEIGPSKTHHMIHRNFASNIYHKLQLSEDFAEDVLKAAEIRKSLG